MRVTKLREWREHRGLTQTDISERTGIPQGTISQIENGVRSPYPRTVRKIADALNVKVEDLTEAPKAEAPRLARQWLEEVVGHSLLAMDDEEARTYQERLTAAVVPEVKRQLQEEFNVLLLAVESDGLDPKLRAELQAAKKTLLQWHMELTKIVKAEQAEGLQVEEL